MFVTFSVSFVVLLLVMIQVFIVFGVFCDGNCIRHLLDKRLEDRFLLDASSVLEYQQPRVSFKHCLNDFLIVCIRKRIQR